MKKLIIKLVAVVLCAAGMIVVINSCGNASLVDFHKVAIPEYKAADYLKLLDNKNNDIVYNAVANLIDHARDYGKELSKDTILDTVQYNLAKEAYHKVSSLLSSNDEWVVCASLRFMANFSSEYKNKEEVAERVLTVKKITKSVQLEMMDAFKMTEGAKSPQFSEKVKSFLAQKSWLVSRYSYPLVMFSGNKEIISSLLENYKNTSDDFEKLLILQSVVYDFDDNVFAFLSKELLSSPDKKIRMFILKSLDNTKDKEKVKRWLSVHYKALERDKTDIAEYSLSNIDSKTGSLMMILLLQNGYDPKTSLTDDKEPLLFEKLWEKQAYYEGKNEKEPNDGEKMDNLKAVIASIFSIKTIDGEWTGYNAKHKAPEYPAEMLKKHQQQMAELVQKTKALFAQYKLDNKSQEEYLRRLQSMDKEFYENAKR
jgi:hypothetical protein